MNKILVLDIGGTFTKYALMNKQGEFIEKGKIPTPLDSKINLFNEIKSLNDKYYDIEGIAISMPGVIDSKNGYAVSGGALEYISECEFSKELEEVVDKPVTIANDAKCATLAEVWSGNLKGINDGVALILGTGIGGGIVVDGKILNGKHFSAGELSFTKCDVNDMNNFTNYLGVISGKSGLSTEVCKTSNKEDLNGVEIFKLIREGNTEVHQGVKNYCNKLAFHMYNLQVILDPERFVIGGGISEESMLIDILREEVKKVYASNPFFKMPMVDIMPCKYRNDSNLLGALYNYCNINCQRELKSLQVQAILK